MLDGSGAEASALAGVRSALGRVVISGRQQLQEWRAGDAVERVPMGDQRAERLHLTRTGDRVEAAAPAPAIHHRAPVTLGAGAPLLPRRIEVCLDELGRNGDLVCGKFTVMRPRA